MLLCFSFPETVDSSAEARARPFIGTNYSRRRRRLSSPHQQQGLKIHHILCFVCFEHSNRKVFLIIRKLQHMLKRERKKKARDEL